MALNSEEVKETIMKLDQLIGKLFEGLKTLSISNEIDVIITSDHGMSNISKEKTVNLYDYINKNWVDRIVGANPVFNIWAKRTFIDSITRALDTVNHLKCWKNENMPERLHYGKNKRTGTHTVIADSNWSILDGSNHYSNSNGAHGYDNENRDMHAIFYAIGPSFKSGFQSKTIKNIDIYPLIAHILGLKVPEIDGKLERVLQFLKETN
jgi:predicted AlkP superfamily pyrophosphatase or phosphodiesterase